MLGKTNAVIGTGGGGGATVTAINKTGATITAGSKVWINENAQTAGSSYQYGKSGNHQGAKLGVIDRNGTFGYQYGKFYSIGSDSVTEVASANDSYINLGAIRYSVDNSMFSNNFYAYRIDGKAQWYLDYDVCIGDNLYVHRSNYNVFQVDMSNGSIINTFTGGDSNLSAVNSLIKIGNYIYRVSGKSQYKWLIDYENNTLTRSSYTFTNKFNNYDLGVADVTLDGKYIIVSNGGQSSATVSAYVNGGTNLSLVEVVDENNLRGLSQSEMPADLQKWYSTKCGFVFNPYTGILTVYEYNGADYGIYKYENGTWTQLPIDLGTTEETKFCSMITVSDDLTRACYNKYQSPDSNINESVIVNLETTSGYVAVPYRFYNVTEDTITGYVGNDTEPDMEVEVSVASMPKIDTGSSDVIVPYEIDYNKVTIVNDYGTLEFSSNDNGNVTVLTGFDGSSGFWFNDAPMFGIDETLEYQFKFRMNDEHRAALAGTVALGNFQSSSEGKVEFSNVLDANLIGISISEDFKGSSKIYLDTTQIIGEWVTVNIRVNEEGNWQIYADKGVVDSYTTTDARGSLTIPLNYYILFGNNYERTPNISVDLEGTGFKQNGEWVYRCVKQI